MTDRPKAIDLVAGVILDLDGTLVDSVHQHVVAWREALLAAGHDIPGVRIHAGIGMGADRLVPWLIGRHVDDADTIANDHTERFLARLDGLGPTPGARELLADLERRDVSFIIATSAGSAEREALLAALGRDDVPVTDAGDVDSSKPAPDLLTAAADKAGFDLGASCMVGDAPWDAVAAGRAGLASSIAVRCGGFADTVLRQSGAGRVVDAPGDLIGVL